MATILVVDDERSIRITIAEFLCDAGYQTFAAANADEALECLRTSAPIDVILTDIVLPRMSGVDLIRECHDVSSNTFAILMTGEPSAETAAEALRLGAADYLMKPVTKSALLRSVGNTIRVKQLSDDRQRLQEANKAYQHNLEELVRERTTELETSNERLQSALRELRATQQQVIRQERLNAVGRLASGIAHDFNNVLMPILGLSGFLLSHPEMLKDGEESSNALDNIYSAAKDAREIVRRLREIYKPADSLEVEAVDFAALVEQSVELTEPAWHPQAEAEGRDIAINLQLPTLPPLMLNASQMRETLTNLILNAVDAMPTGGQIDIVACRDGNTVRLDITDSGVGMDPQTVDRCLEPFFTTKGEHGTGLGLSMCHGIVQRHSGDFTIDSTPGEGTTVTISLPLAEQGDTPPAEADSQTRDEHSAPAEIPAAHILVADDQEASRALVSSYLRAQGHTVDCAESGEDTIKQLEVARYDLLLTDRAMPGMAGDEVARQARSIAPAMPVVLLTGFGDLMNHCDEKPDGVDLVVSKPITDKELASVVSRLLTERNEGGNGHDPDRR